MRELRYCAALPGSRQGGQVGRAQDEAIRRGWLVALPPIAIAGAAALRLHITAAGRGAIDRAAS